MNTLPTDTGWLARFPLARLTPWEPEGVNGDLVVDVRRRDADGGWLVLCARDLGIAGGGTLRCHFGFCDDAAIGDALRSRGFRVLEAQVRWSAASGRLEVLLDDGRSVLSLVGLKRLTANHAAWKSAAGQTLRYQQQLLAPDLGQPDSELRALDTDVEQEVWLLPAAAPGLATADGSSVTFASSASHALWTTTTTAATVRSQSPRRQLRTESWPLPPAYHFSDVEAIGLRLDLADWGASPSDKSGLVKALMGRLNFHRKFARGGEAHDFEFRAASSTLVLELLRYGRMETDPPTQGPAQSQHELVLRVLVGRVDDATGQAHDPAFYVPAIFVDNAWSRLLGRELQGFDKQMAAFCTAGGTPLRPNGCLPDLNRPLPLDQVASVRLLPRVGAPPGSALLELADLPAVADKDFIDVDDSVVLAGFAIAGMGWRQHDFEDAEFRRAFARETMAGRLSGFRSVQVSPVDGRPLSPAWIGGRFEFERLRVALPTGQPRLRLLAAQDAPTAWNALAMLAQGRELALPAGDWYRLRFDMSLKVDDGLAW